MQAGHLQEKSGRWYCVISYYIDGKPKSKWISTGLKVKGNKKRAEEKLFLARLLFDPLEPDRDLKIKESSNAVTPEVISVLQQNLIMHAETDQPYDDQNTYNCSVQAEEAESKYYLTDLCKEWLEYSHPPRVSENTYAGYKSPIKNHLEPYFRNNPCLVKNLSVKYVQRYFNGLYQKGLSKKTIANHRGILSGMFRYAISIRELQENPLVHIPPPEKTQPVENYFSADELATLLRNVKDTDFSYPVYMAAVYGLRRGEVCGLKWSAIDFKNQTFSIRHTLHEVSDPDEPHIIVFGKDETKSKKVRSYPLLDEIAEMLLDIREKQKASNLHNEDGYVYLNKKGKPVRPNYITEHFPQVLNEFHLKHIRYHDLRHSCASILLSDKKRSVSLRDIQSWLGHSNIQSTMRYAHIKDVTTKAHTAELMNNIAFCKAEKNL